LTADQLARVDVDANGWAGFNDVSLISSYSSGRINTFPACNSTPTPSPTPSVTSTPTPTQKPTTVLVNVSGAVWSDYAPSGKVVPGVEVLIGGDGFTVSVWTSPYGSFSALVPLKEGYTINDVAFLVNGSTVTVARSNVFNGSSEYGCSKAYYGPSSIRCLSAVQLVMVSGIQTPTPTFSPTLTPIPSPTPVTANCVDSDEGLNYYVYGFASKGSEGMSDCCKNSGSGACVTTGSQLAEAYCNNDAVAQFSFNCPAGCSNGVCQNATVTAIPTIGKYSPSSAGTGLATSNVKPWWCFWCN
jgi:hypothetical protein